VIGLFDTLFRFFGRLIFTPILMGWMIGAVLFGAMIGFIIGGVVAISAFGPPLGQSAWEWAIIAPPVFIGAVFGFQYWRGVSGADAYFGLTGDSHGSARFASRKELKKLQGEDGLLIGRNPGTGRLLRYDGPAHLITLAPTRAGKGVGTVIPNLLAAERSVLVIDPKGENARIAGEARRRF
ncbi:type IV secretory system conjugative DNA transfer family protein, partial [Sulfitobacter sp. HI0021]